MNNYWDKLKYLANHQKGICPVCGKQLTRLVDLHHMFSNTRWGKIKYPKMIHSLLNLRVVHCTCHLNKIGKYKYTDYQAGRIEDFLMRHPEMCKFVNEINV